MPDKIARERLKQKVLERWENEGGKLQTEPKGAPGNNPTEDPAKGGGSLIPIEQESRWHSSLAQKQAQISLRSNRALTSNSW